MAVIVKDITEDEHVFNRANDFSTEESYNNLEVIGPDGRIVAAFSGEKWISAVIVPDE